MKRNTSSPMSFKHSATSCLIRTLLRRKKIEKYSRSSLTACNLRARSSLINRESSNFSCMKTVMSFSNSWLHARENKGANWMVIKRQIAISVLSVKVTSHYWMDKMLRISWIKNLSRACLKVTKWADLTVLWRWIKMKRTNTLRDNSNISTGWLTLGTMD